jgi:hypothetical protein
VLDLPELWNQITVSAGCCARAASGQATTVLPSAAMNFRLAILIAIGGHADWNAGNNSTLQYGGL